MTMKKIFLATFLSVICFSFSFSQGNGRRDFGGDQFYERIKAEKINFLAPKLNLTPSEAQAFWPVFNEFEKKKWEITGKRIEMEQMSDRRLSALTDDDVARITKSYIESFELEVNTRKEYHKKFTQILPLRKVVQVYKAENDFKEYMIKKYSPSFGPGGGPGGVH